MAAPLISLQRAVGAGLFRSESSLTLPLAQQFALSLIAESKDIPGFARSPAPPPDKSGLFLYPSSMAGPWWHGAGQSALSLLPPLWSFVVWQESGGMKQGALAWQTLLAAWTSSVVSKQYRDLLAKNKQELFFGSRWHLQLLLGELGGEIYKLPGCSRLVARFASGADYQRQFRQVCVAFQFGFNLCVTARSNTLTFEECQPSSQQLLSGQDLGLLFLQDYKQRTNSEASYDSVVDTSQDLGVDEFTKHSLNVACETNQAVRKLSFGVGGVGAGDSGLSGSCTSTVLRGTRRDRGVTLPFSFRNEGADRFFRTRDGHSNEGFKMYLDDNFDNEVHWESWIRFPLLSRAIPEEAGPVKGICRLNTETGTDARSFECSDGIRRICFYGRTLAKSIIACTRAIWLGSVNSNSFRLEAIEINLDRGIQQTYLAPNFKPTTSNQFFWRADNLGGLDSLQLTCGVGEVITSFSKVLGLGACVEKTSLEQVEIDSKERGLVEIDCAEGHVIKKLETEVNYVTESFRLKATCCFVASMPFTLRPYQQFDTADVDELSGIFCPKPEGLDDSGRPELSQQLSFKFPSNVPQAELQYDKALGKWSLKDRPSPVCASTDPAVESDVVHPLNLALGRFYVVPMTNFDGVFETPVGVARDAATPQPPPKPTLITFSATSPDFAAECQDENTPGTRTFDRKRMNQKAQELLSADSEHPCGYIFSEPRTSREVAAPGLSWWPQSDVSPYAGIGFRAASGGFDGGDETGSGVTYRTVKECSDRVKSRQIDNSADKFPITTGLLILDKLKDDKQATAEAVVKLSAGLGAETEWSPGLTLNSFSRVVANAGKAVLTTYAKALERDFNKANANDCDPLQHGLARIFCDLYCIRDFVKKGDAAILQNLQSATDTLNQNLQELFSFYAGAGLRLCFAGAKT
ncbi:unnamed protein product [Symbiodinium necroappetens]|uniref:Uncharacterized protein n=1 Tax=Symbiodinium necroappetens TaxID=1628268 RepID=A0A812RC37_9DINO|nr:unnamed protein product [Symbiodinium necroappetens]